MGNAHAKEAGSGNRGGPNQPGGSSSGAGHHGDHADRSRRASRGADLGGLSLLTGGGSSSSRQQTDAPFERRETKQEREARRLERERVARLKERERSMKEEHVDGGFLVTMGVYTAMEDFNKPVVRQLQIERKMAPFWRGLDDWNPSWAEHQIIAAARGLDIPPPDVVPDNLVPQPRPPESSSSNINNLTVPMGPRTLSAASDRTGSNPGSSLPSPTTTAPPRTTSPLKPHKAIAAALSISSSRNTSQQDITPREINLPNDPFVNGQPLEVFLYKECVECPICCMYYPRFLNKTRCCDQYICSECFAQIKRPDPHLPEHHGDGDNAAAAADADEAANPNEFVMEPACCPYCTQTELGVTYEPPPFRRGLTYAMSGLATSMGTAMSSTTSLGSSLSPTSATGPSGPGRRRTESLSANAPGVISTDRIRPDWSTKLATARAQQRRRAAAADALHHAAFVMGNNESARTIFGRPARFSRRNTRESPSGGANSGQVDGPTAADTTPRTSSARTGPSRERIDAAHLESMMMAEAIRLSLADEEERRKKAEKEARKEAKKKEKDERKANKRKSSIYGDGPSSASASSLSLSLPFGRKSGNSAGGNLRMEAAANASASATANTSQSNEASQLGSVSGPGSTDATKPAAQDIGKGKAVDRGEGQTSDTTAAGPSTLPIPISHSRGSSHLRQMSNASSVSSSGIDSLAGSYGPRHQDPRTSGLSVGDSGKSDDSGPAGAESMFNFTSLAKVIGVPIDGTSEGEVIQATGETAEGTKASEAGAEEHIEHAEDAGTAATKAGETVSATRTPTEADASVTPANDTTADDETAKKIDVKLDTSNAEAPTDHQGSESKQDKDLSATNTATNAPAPSLTVTPETPAPLPDGQEHSKRLGDDLPSGAGCGLSQITQ